MSKVGDVYEIHTQRLGLNNEQERLKIELATLQQEPESELMPVKPEAASALRRLQSVFQAHGVRMVSAAATTPLAHSSQSVDSVAKAFTDIGHKGAERWNVTLQAPYTAMVELLEVCATNAPPIVAESLTLSIAGGEKQAPYWTVRLCL
ncbi:MAG: hypothetical protein GX230_07605 [Lentisphaerae bacterium]|nr:hypothetical protein [Lentisphaerota bacterium]